MLLEILEKFEQAKKYWVPFPHADNVEWVVYPDRYILEAVRFLKGDRLDRLMAIIEANPRLVYTLATKLAEDLIEEDSERATACECRVCTGSSQPVCTRPKNVYIYIRNRNLYPHELQSFLYELGFKTTFELSDDNHKLVIVD
jgi:hypothetical protein